MNLLVILDSHAVAETLDNFYFFISLELEKLKGELQSVDSFLKQV